MSPLFPETLRMLCCLIFKHKSERYSRWQTVGKPEKQELTWKIIVEKNN